MIYKSKQVQLALGMQAGRINMGKHHFDAHDSDWTLLDRPDDLHEPRKYRKTVNFEEPFDEVPYIHLGLVSFDSYHQFNNRLSVQIADVTKHSFTVEAFVWWDTKVWGCGVGWLAIPLKGDQ